MLKHTGGVKILYDKYYRVQPIVVSRDCGDRITFVSGSSGATDLADAFGLVALRVTVFLVSRDSVAFPSYSIKCPIFGMGLN